MKVKESLGTQREVRFIGSQDERSFWNPSIPGLTIPTENENDEEAEEKHQLPSNNASQHFVLYHADFWLCPVHKLELN